MITAADAKHAAWLWGAREDLRETACWVLFRYVRALPPGPERDQIMAELEAIKECALMFAVPNFKRGNAI